MGALDNKDVNRWLKPDGLVLLECWSRDGFTMQEIADKMGVTRACLWLWRKNYPEIEDAMKSGREVVDYRVENALLKIALGYQTTETKTIISGSPDRDGNRPIRVERTEKEIAPNVTAIMAWLNNRKPKQWKRNRDNNLELDDKQNNITVNIIRKGKEEKDDEDWDATVVKSSNKVDAKAELDDEDWDD